MVPAVPSYLAFYKMYTLIYSGSCPILDAHIVLSCLIPKSAGGSPNAILVQMLNQGMASVRWTGVENDASAREKLPKPTFRWSGKLRRNFALPSL